MRAEFDGYALDTDAREVIGADGEIVPLEPQAFDVLAVLVRERHRVVSRSELLDEVWGSQFVTDSALATRIKQIRQALGDDGRRQGVVKTFHGRGVRFVAEVAVGSSAVPRAEVPLDCEPPVFDAEHTVGPLIGRADDLTSAAQKLDRHRLVTITGPGGVGKTHLLHHVVGRAAGEDAPTPVLVELAPLRSGDALGAAVLSALGVGDDGRADAVEAAIRHLRPTATLLALDNAEHVIDDVAGFCRLVLGDCPSVRLVVSSRRPLAVAGEALHALDPLDEDESAELFVRQAQLVGARMEATDEAVRELCRRVDGVPLAVRVLAGRSHVFSIDDLATDLSAHLGRSGTLAPVPGRHESVEAALSWSIEALDDDDRRVLTDLSVMAGWFDLTSAAAVAGTDDVAAPLLRLQQQSLVTASPDGRVSRFRLLEPIRLFVAAGRDDRGAERRHADHFLAVAEQAARDIEGPGIDAGFETIEREWANLRIAYEHHHVERDLASMTRMVDALANYAEANLTSEVHRFAAIAFGLHEELGAAVPLSLRANHARFISHRGDLEAVGQLLAGIVETDGSTRLSTALMTRDFFVGDLDATRRSLEATLERAAGTGGFTEMAFSALATISGALPAERVAELAARLERLGASGGRIARTWGRFGLAVRQLSGGDRALAIDTLSEVEEAFEDGRHSGFARVASSLRSLALLGGDDPEQTRSLMVRSIERGLAQGAGSMLVGEISRAAGVLASFGQVETAYALATTVKTAGFAAGAEAVERLDSTVRHDDAEAAARGVATGRYLSVEDAARLAIEALTGT